MGLNKVAGSAWDTQNNVSVNVLADLYAYPEQKGVLILSGRTTKNDGGGGVFIYDETMARGNHNGGTIIDRTGSGIGTGCWVRQYEKSAYSLKWFGVENTIANLKSAYGVADAILNIPDSLYGGDFVYRPSKIGEHDGVNNFNGWVRQLVIGVVKDAVEVNRLAIAGLKSDPLTNGATTNSNSVSINSLNTLTVAQGNSILTNTSAINTKLNKATKVVGTSGVNITGTLANDNLSVGLQFATPADAIDSSITNLPVAPSNIATAISAATRKSEFNNITGLLPKFTESKFLLSAMADRTKVSYPEFSAVFNGSPYVRAVALVSLTMPAGVIQIPAGVGLASHKVVLTKSGVIRLQQSAPLLNSVDEILLGTIGSIDGSIGVGATGDQIFTTPWLASSDFSTRNHKGYIEGGIISPSTTVGSVKLNPTTYYKEGVNWKGDTTAPHSILFTKPDPLTFTYLNKVGSISGPIGTAKVKGNLTGDGVTVDAGSFTIQVGYINALGEIGVLLGQSVYADLSSALAAVGAYSPTVPAIMIDNLEFTRWIVRGDQYEGHADYDVQSPDRFSVATSTNSSSTGSVTAGEISSSNTSNSLSSTNLQFQVDQLSDRTDILNAIHHLLTVNGVAADESGNVTVTTDSIGAVKANVKVNGHFLVDEVTITQADIGLPLVENIADVDKVMSTPTKTYVDTSISTKIVESGRGNKGVVYEYVNGNISKVTSTLPLGPEVVTYTYTNGKVTQTVTVYNGVTETATYVYDNVTGFITGVTKV